MFQAKRDPDLLRDLCESDWFDLSDNNSDKLLEFIFQTDYANYLEKRVKYIKELSSVTGLQMHNIIIKYVNKIHKIKFVCDSPDDDFHKKFYNFVNLYNRYQQRYFFVDNVLINSFNDSANVTWFDLFQSSDMLGYATSGYLKQYYSTHHNIKINKNRFTDSDGLREVLSRARKPGAKNMMEQIGFSLATKIQSPEANILEQIIEFIKEINLDYELQYKCGTYKIDMYIPKHNIVIEVDECGHADRDPIYEKTREEFIMRMLKPKMLRINPNIPNFRMIKEIGTLNRLIYC